MNREHFKVDRWLTVGPSLHELENLRRFIHEKVVRNNVSVSKLRKFYESVVKMRAFINDTDTCKRLAYKMFVILHYELGRERNEGLKALLNDLVRPAIRELDRSNWDVKKMKNFVELMEAVVAFHREKARKN